MSRANEALLWTFFDSFNHSEGSSLIDQFCGPAFILHDSSTGQQRNRDACKETINSWHAAFPDVRVELQSCAADGDEVETRWRWVGTHDGEFMGVSATHRRVAMSGMTLWRVEGGQLTAAWLRFDAGYLRQLLEEPPSWPAPRSEEDEKSRDPGHREIRIRSWSEFVQLVTSGEFRDWAFRGQQSAGWTMESSLSRHLLKRRIHRSLWQEQEERIIRIFRRKAHLFLQHLPDSNDTFEWIALMQHHGAPTRLLDFTWSPYVAAFFALEHAEDRAAVWAINSKKLLRQRHPGADFLPPKVVDGLEFVTLDPRQQGVFERVFLPGTAPVVGIADPEMMNQRLIAQQGTFLIPGRLDKPVESILHGYEDSHSLLAQFILYPEVRDEAMRELLNMNITNATLFPGLDGLARSMTYELEFHWDFDLRNGERR